MRRFLPSWGSVEAIGRRLVPTRPQWPWLVEGRGYFMIGDFHRAVRGLNAAVVRTGPRARRGRPSARESGIRLHAGY